MDNAVLRDQLLALLEGGNAHITFKRSIEDFPMNEINTRVPEIPYSSWELIEHMRIAQYDILDFIKNAGYKERKWPDDYWPPRDKTANRETWNKTIKSFNDDLNGLKELIEDPRTDFTAPIPHAPDYNILREILVVADHNSYHTGQIILIRRALKIY
jgi:DinB superfamily